ncbi:hypothetical protein NBRC111894_920 [Sporolactobacillus inulinus]|uniref:Uncharacterized protein n=1 Tax=Sporolactobacillus inulinus TaxID=2078 RepID=A0A4Y1Z8P4_9BACL|nr:hypothetical protein NBRC111894_920 [Sporolactobacillus inulinus]
MSRLARINKARSRRRQSAFCVANGLIDEMPLVTREKRPDQPTFSLKTHLL